MYRVLIVEDDNLIRNGLVKIIGKMNIPSLSLFEAKDGIQALEMFKETPFDIIITDIKMPHMDGLQLLDNIKAMNTKTKFIILSGYNEFSFAQQAINLNVSEYLLKPVKRDKLYSSLTTLIDQLDKERKAMEQDTIKEAKIHAYKSMILREVLNGYYKPEAIQSTLNEADIVFCYDGFSVLSIYNNLKHEEADAFIHENVDYENIYASSISPHGHYIYLLNINNNDLNSLYTKLRSRTQSFACKTKSNLYIGISTWTNNINRIFELVNQAEYALDFRIIDTKNFVYEYTNMADGNISPNTLSLYYESITNAVNIKSSKEISINIDSLIEHVIHSYKTPVFLKDSIDELFICYILPKYKDRLCSKWDIEAIYQSCETLGDFKNKIKHILYGIIKFDNEDEYSNASHKIKSAIKYISSNYNKQLSLEDVANHVNTNTSYFSSIFKKNTGMNFVNYLNKVRIEKSKELLADPKYKIYEIAEIVGFCNEKYYFKVFKSYTGITPSQYREKYSS